MDPEVILKYLVSSEKTVLGLDIYKYSKKKEDKQKLVPIVFDILYRQTVEWITEFEIEIFTDLKNIRKKFIHTGDGGFQIFDNPIVGIVFLIYFFTILTLFNNGNCFDKIRKFVGKIEIRACLTLGNIYKYNKKYFGKPIIQNARILSADKLNRFLIDENINNWFDKHLNGLTSIKIRTARDIEKILKIPNESYTKSRIFPQSHYLEVDSLPVGGHPIVNVTNQKIGELSVKNDINSIYNVELQRIANIGNIKEPKTLIVNIGNSNTNGLSI